MQLSEQEQVRREKLEKIKAMGVDPYPAPLYPVNVTSKEIKENYKEEVLEDVEVAIYEMDDKGQRRFLKKIVSANGHYDFPVEPSRKYLLEARRTLPRQLSKWA